MNRGLLSFLIVLGVAAAGGTAAYVLTDMYGEPEGFLTPTAAEPAGPPPPPPLAPPPPPSSSSTKMLLLLFSRGGGESTKLAAASARAG